MNYITDDLYKKMQMFCLPIEEGISLAEIAEEWGVDLDDFFLQELLARDEWYIKYTPKQLKSLLFDDQGQVIFTHLTEEILALVQGFRENCEEEWAEAQRLLAEEQAQVARVASVGVGTFLAMDLQDSQIQSVSGLDSDKVVIRVNAGWDGSEMVTMTFTGVKESWMGKLHPEDANWWLYHEIFLDERGLYGLNVLFDHAEYIGHLQMVFSDVMVEKQKLDD